MLLIENQSNSEQSIQPGEPVTDRITFRQFVVAAVCAHGDPIGDTWRRPIARSAFPHIAPETAVEGVLLLAQRWVLSELFREPASGEEAIGGLAAFDPSRNRGVSAEEVEIIWDLWCEFEHVHEIFECNPVGGNQCPF